MNTLLCVSHFAAEEVSITLESHRIKCHIDGKEVKHQESNFSSEVKAEIAPWLANSANEAEI